MATGPSAQVSLESVSMLREEVQRLMRKVREAAGQRDVAALMNLYADEAVAISPVFGEVHGKRPSPLRGRHCSLSLVILHLRFPTFWWTAAEL
jgi:hypothetical protein